MASKKVDFDSLVPVDPPPEKVRSNWIWIRNTTQIFDVRTSASFQGIVLFGKDLSQIPCFRNSFLYGISIGIGVGFLAFLKTSRPQLSSHIGFGSFCGTVLCYWFPCRWVIWEGGFSKLIVVKIMQATEKSFPGDMVWNSRFVTVLKFFWPWLSQV